MVTTPIGKPVSPKTLRGTLFNQGLAVQNVAETIYRF